MLFYIRIPYAVNKRRYSSGQRGHAVNVLASAYGGSNPSRRTTNELALFLENFWRGCGGNRQKMEGKFLVLLRRQYIIPIDKQTANKIRVLIIVCILKML